MTKHIATYSDTIEIFEILNTFETIKEKLFDCLRKETLTPSDHAQITQWLTDYPTLVTTTNTNSWTPLHIAAECGKQHILEILLQKGADKEAQTKNGSPPLHIAAQYGHKKIQVPSRR